MIITPRTRILATFIVAALLLVWIGKSPQPEPDNYLPVEPEIISDTLTLTGTIIVVHEDNQAFDEADVHTYFVNEKTYEIDDSWQSYNRQEVRATVDVTLQNDGAFLDILEVQPLSNEPQSGVAGNEKWVNVACRFADMTDQTPQPLDYFERILNNDEPGMDDYWRQTSAQQVNIDGSRSFGWYDLPRTKPHYERIAGANVGFALRTMLTDCANEAVKYDHVDFRDYGGINIMLNDTFGCCAWGGSMPLTIDGKLITFRVTWLPPWAFNSLHVIAHEMGHGWGLPHSSGPYGYVYDSAWDVMSGGTRMLDTCNIGTVELGCYQVGTIAHHLERLGWITPERSVYIRTGETETITLDALTTLESTDNTLIINAVIDKDLDRRFYTIEVRQFVAYDRNLPGAAVIIHEVMPDRSSPAHVVDADGNGNPNDEGAMWTVGEIFEQDGIRVEILSADGTTMTVRISNDS